MRALPVPLAVALTAACAAGPAERLAVASVGSWRITGGQVAPWVDGSTGQPSRAGLSGTRIDVAPERVHASPPLGCGQAEVEFVVTPAEGLFQGGLPAPAAAAARALGMARIPTLTMRVRCDGGLWDYHHTAGDTLFVALDNVIWKLAPEKHASTPASVVRALLAEHMTGDMGFTPGQLAGKREHLSADLVALAGQYFARLHPDDVPPINGDPFTDSQEYPDRFTLETIEAGATQSRVRAVFSDGYRTRPVDFLLVRPGRRWLLDDIRYEDGTTLRDWLRA